MSNDKHDGHGKPDPKPDPHDKIVIHIDQNKFDAPAPVMDGNELRMIASVPETRTLWRDVPGGDDDLIEDAEKITLKNGMHFYTVAKTVSPG